VRAAEPVYRMFGLSTTGHETSDLPEFNNPLFGRIGYHIRIGKHALADFDWVGYLEFANNGFHPKYLAQHEGFDRILAFGNFRLLKEARHFIEAPRTAYRIGDRLHLRTHSGVDRIYADLPPSPQLDVMNIFSYLGSTAKGAYQMVQAGFYESTAYLLINPKHGLDIRVDSIPLFSPDGKRFLTCSMGLDAGETPNRLMVWRTEEPLPVLEWNLEPSKWGPKNAEWISNEAVGFDEMTPRPDGQFDRVTRRIDWVGGKWTIDQIDSSTTISAGNAEADTLAIANSEGTARRDGDNLILTMYGLSSRVYTNQNRSPQSDNYTLFRYLGNLVSGRFHLVEVDNVEDVHYAVVDRQTGIEHQLESRPLACPNGTRFLVSSCNMMSILCLDIWKIEDASIFKEFSVRPDGWCPKEAQWLSDYEISFRSHPLDAKPQNTSRDTTESIKFGAEGWICSIDGNTAIADDHYYEKLEREAIAAVSGSVRRTGEILDIELVNGLHRTYLNCNFGTDASTGYSYIGSLLDRTFHVISIGGYECRFGILLLDAANGKETLLNDLPVVSPDNQRLLTFNSEPDGYCGRSQIQIWRIESGQGVKEFQISPLGWEPSEVQWLSGTEISFVQTFPQAAPPVSPTPEVHFFRLTTGGWESTSGAPRDPASISDDENEAKAIQASGDRVKRVGRNLEIALLNGHSRSYAHYFDENDSDIYYRYLGTFLDTSYHLINKGGRKCSMGIILLDAKDGKETVINGVPIPSPDNSKFIAVANADSAQCGEMEIQVWRIESGEAVNEFSRQFKRTSLESIRWESQTEAALTLKLPFPSDPQIVSMTLFAGANGWGIREDK